LISDILIQQPQTSRHGGNRKPKRLRHCAQCNELFTPARLTAKYCSQACKATAQVMAAGERKPRPIATTEARRAQRRVAWLIESGRLTRPSACEECGCETKTEGAHYDYDQPELVRWLCRSCHSKWDCAEPKGGTI
jgi:hypothetical protein